MDCKDFIIFVALCTAGAFCSYHGPTANPKVLKSGFLADTHEVVAAKNAHHASLAKESHYEHGGDHSDSYGYADDFSESHGNVDNYHPNSHGHVTKYHGPTAKPVVLKSGYLADTHEVAAAKGAHLAVLAKESHYGDGDHSGSYSPGGDYLSNNHGRTVQYHGPTPVPHVLKSGYLADTHEVAAAKGAHLAALAKESHHGQGGDYSASYGFGGDSHSYGRGHGPTAIPHVLKSGYLGDTHEVTAAKHNHLAALYYRRY